MPWTKYFSSSTYRFATRTTTCTASTFTAAAGRTTRGRDGWSSSAAATACASQRPSKRRSRIEAILYWATGLTETYLDGALTRAMRGDRPSHIETPRPAPPLVGYGVDSTERRARLTHIERDILAFFDRGRNRVLTQELFDAVPHTHADVVRAIEDLEKQGHFVNRRTEEGNDWVVLTDEGQRL